MGGTVKFRDDAERVRILERAIETAIRDLTAANRRGSSAATIKLAGGFITEALTESLKRSREMR